MMCSSSLPQESHGFCIGTLLQTYAEMIIIAVVIPIAIVIAVSVAVASAIRELKQRRRGRQRERQKSNRLNRQNNNFARASRFFVHFLAVAARLQRESA